MLTLFNQKRVNMSTYYIDLNAEQINNLTIIWQDSSCTL